MTNNVYLHFSAHFDSALHSITIESNRDSTDSTLMLRNDLGNTVKVVFTDKDLDQLISQLIQLKNFVGETTLKLNRKEYNRKKEFPVD